jgi:adenosylcobinamide-GDP ribazoletransferase
VLLPGVGGTALAVVAWVWSRHALAWACRRGVPAAQPTGLGALVADTVNARRLVLALIGCAVVALTAAVAGGVPWWHAVVGPGAALAVTLALVQRCSRRLGGVTGDVLGAVVEAALSAALVGAAVVTAWLA